MNDLESEADRILAEAAAAPVCPECGEVTRAGDEVVEVPVEDEPGNPVRRDGRDLVLLLGSRVCPQGHRSWEGDGQARGTRGAHSYLSGRQLDDRRRREVYVTSGVPDPSRGSGLFRRAHRPTS